jgi:hypothetical protein
MTTQWDEVGAGSGIGSLDLGPLKESLHRQVIDSLDLTIIAKLDGGQLKAELSKLVTELLESESVPLSMKEREELIADIQHEVMGLGPLEPLVQDQSVNDILVNRCDQIYVERAGKLELTDIKFRDEGEDCVRSGSENRRIVSDGRCTFVGWLTCECHYSTVSVGWVIHFHQEIFKR